MRVVEMSSSGFSKIDPKEEKRRKQEK